MAGKVIQTVLTLKDGMSPGLLKIAKNTEGVSKEMVTATAKVQKFGRQAKDSLSSALSTTNKFAAGAAALIGGAALKTGFAEAFSLEAYRTQLETATKDTERAAQVMTYAIDLANRTPFEGGDLVAAASKLEMFGLSTERWLPVLGDAAAGVSRSIGDVQDGFTKAVTTGDFASLRDTLSITKDMVDEFAQQNAGRSFLNADGSIADMQLLQSSLEALLIQKFGGGMEKLSKTTQGVWSTITGVTKNSLAQMVGMSNDGTVRAGSALDTLKQHAEGLAGRLMQMQQDGSLDALGQKLDQFLTKALDFASNAIQFFVTHGKGLTVAFMAINGAVAAVKVYKFGKDLLEVAKAVPQFISTISQIAAARAANAAADGAAAVASTANTTATAANTGVTVSNTGATVANTGAKGGGLAAMVAATGSWIANTAAIVANKVGLVASTVATTALSVCTGVLTAAQLALNTAFYASPVGWVVLGIMALVAAGIALYKNWDTVCQWAKKLGDFLMGGLRAAIDGVCGFFKGLWDTVCKVVDAIKGFFGIKGDAKFTASVETKEANSVATVGRNALGTSYWRGGLTRINERGGEIITLPSGSRILPADLSQKAMSPTINVKVTIQGNVIGNKEYIDYLGNEVSNRILRAMKNVR